MSSLICWSSARASVVVASAWITLTRNFHMFPFLFGNKTCTPKHVTDITCYRTRFVLKAEATQNENGPSESLHKRDEKWAGNSSRNSARKST